MKPKVYFSREITPEKVLELYRAVGVTLPGNVAVKVHSGEKGNQNFLRPDFWKPVIDHVGGTVVECNTAYEGARNTTERHRKLLMDHGWHDYFAVDLLDAEGPDLVLDIPKGKVIQKNYVGKDIVQYDSMLVLSHFKGHPMGGYGGAVKQLSIGIASSFGKKFIHGAGDPEVFWEADHDSFLEAMADAAGSIVEYFRGNIVYINVMKNMSVDCDCCAIATVNPYRYRGYYYDIEIGMYYLQSRYYDPIVGRFINIDQSDIVYRFNGYIEALNYFAYCTCNPINYSDETGQWRFPKLVAVGVQVEANVSFLTVGLEVIFAGNKIYLFRYNGGTYGKEFDDILGWIKTSLSNSFSARNLRKSIKKLRTASFSVSVFAVFSFTKSYFSAADYSGPFVGFSTTIPTIYGVAVKAFVTTYSVYTCVGVGFSYPSSFDYSVAYTYYKLCGTLSLPTSIRNFANKQAKGLKP